MDSVLLLSVVVGLLLCGGGVLWGLLAFLVTRPSRPAPPHLPDDDTRARSHSRPFNATTCGTMSAERASYAG